MRVPLYDQPFPGIFEPVPQFVHFQIPHIPLFNFSTKEWVSMMAMYTMNISVFLPAFLTGNKHLFKVFTRASLRAFLWQGLAYFMSRVLCSLLFVGFTAFFLWIKGMARGYVSAILAQAETLFERKFDELLSHTIYASLDTDEPNDLRIASFSIVELAFLYAYCIGNLPLLPLFHEQVTNWFLLHRITKSCPSALKSPTHVLLLGSALAAVGAIMKIQIFDTNATRCYATIADFALEVWLNVSTNLCSIVSLAIVSVSMTTNAVSGQRKSLMGSRLKSIAFIGVSDGLVRVARNCTSALVRFNVLAVLSALVAVSWRWFLLTFVRTFETQRAAEGEGTSMEIVSGRSAMSFPFYTVASLREQNIS